MGYRCPNQTCAGDIVYRSAFAESLSLKYYSFGMDVILEIGQLRFHQNQTVGEIHARLSKTVTISQREVEYLIETYMMLIAGVKQSESYLAAALSPDGIILSIDGIQPEKGNEVLYILRDVLSGEVLRAENLLCSDQAAIESIIQPVIDLGYPILGIISDGQQAIRKAVESLLPSVPYQLCHYHYLKGMAKGLQDADRKLKTKLKQEIRDIRTVEKRIQDIDDETDRTILWELSQAIRSVTLTSSVYPFDCGGIKVYDKLVHLSQTVKTLIQNRSHPLLMRLSTIISRYQDYETQYTTVNQLLTVVKRMATLIAPDSFADDSEQKRKSRLVGYLGHLAKLKKQCPEIADSLAHIHKLTLSFLCGLFSYSECQQLPVTNNDLEIFHRRVKTEHRRTTGRRSSHDYMIRYGKFAVYQMGKNCADQAAGFAYAKFKQLKEQLKAIKQRYSQMYQFKHRRDEFLYKLITQWAESATPEPIPT
jgi:hypothetical protein